MVVVIVPAWMPGDGEYVELAVGEQVTTGLALAVTTSTAPAAADLAQPGGLRVCLKR
ncbi:MAG: hypothetical protein QOE59_4120 [Actinomycetota bacterium]|nr:hypothetical protein [Actinomycetota bacterium]